MKLTGPMSPTNEWQREFKLRAVQWEAHPIISLLVSFSDPFDFLLFSLNTIAMLSKLLLYIVIF